MLALQLLCGPTARPTLNSRSLAHIHTAGTHAKTWINILPLPLDENINGSSSQLDLFARRAPVGTRNLQ